MSPKNTPPENDGVTSSSKHKATPSWRSASPTAPPKSVGHQPRPAQERLCLSASATTVDRIALIMMILGVLYGLLKVISGWELLSRDQGAGLLVGFSGALTIAASILVYGLISAFMTLVQAQIDMRNWALARK